MTLSELFAALTDHGIELAVHEDQLRFRPVEALTAELRNSLESHKPELLTIVARRSVAEVGECDHCHADLIGLPTFDGFINRVCPDCGQWFRCIPAA